MKNLIHLLKVVSLGNGGRQPAPLSQFKQLIVCRGPIAWEALWQARALGMPPPDLVLTQREWIDDRAARPTWISNRGLFGEIHLIDDYNNISAIMEIASRIGAHGIYAGYGFKAESPEFAKACEDHGIGFSSPSSAVMLKVSKKDDFRKVAKAAGAKPIPGFDDFREWLVEGGKEIGLAADEDFFVWAEDRVERIWADYPEYAIRLKIAGGGGGKGQVIVLKGEDLRAAIRSIWEEYGAATPHDKRFVIELNIPRPRHLEVQVFGDGNKVVHMAERDCSIQTRWYQKLFELALSEAAIRGIIADFPGDEHRALREDLEREISRKAELQRQALAIARTVGLDSASTIEFLVDENQNVFALEMNTRIQVEHGISEEIARFRDQKISLVGLQMLRMAGYPLEYEQGDITFTGASLELRIGAQDSTTLQPAPGGTIHEWGNHAVELGPDAHIAPHQRVEDGGLSVAGLPRPDPYEPGYRDAVRLTTEYDANFELDIYTDESYMGALRWAAAGLRIMRYQGDDLFKTTIPLHRAILAWLIENYPVRPTTEFIDVMLAYMARLKKGLDTQFAAGWEKPFQKKPRENLVVRPIRELLKEPALVLAFAQEKRGICFEITPDGVKLLQPPGEILRRLHDFLHMEAWPEDVQEFDRAYREEEVTVLKKLFATVVATDFFSFRRAEGRLHIVVPSDLDTPEQREPLIATAVSVLNSGNGQVQAPVQGGFFLQPAPGAEPYVRVGQRVRKGDTLAVMLALKKRFPVVADRDGVVKEFRVENGARVARGQVVAIIE